MVVRAWDLAATAATGGNDPDWTTGVKMTRDQPGRFIVLDVVHMRGSPHEVETAIAEAARIDGTSVSIGLPQDPGQAGKHQAKYLASRLAGYRIAISPETGAKTTRAAPVASQVEARNFAIVRAGWNHAFLEELRDFPVRPQGRPGRCAIACLHDADRGRGAGAPHLVAVPDTCERRSWRRLWRTTVARTVRHGGEVPVQCARQTCAGMP